MTPRMTVALACAALFLAACSGGDGGESPQASPQTTASSQPPERPGVGECHQLDVDELLGSADQQPAVACSEKHTTETVHVGTFKAAAADDPKALTGDKANRRAAQTCQKEAASYLGADQRQLRLTRVSVFWFVPLPQEVDAGADWLRCDVVVFERGNDLMQLPRTLKGALSKNAATGRYGLCGSARPGAKDFERVVCSKKHTWRAISTIPISGGKRYPGTKTVRAAGKDTCQSRARAAQGNALQYGYGWEWPTKEQWQAGQRFGYCWAPA